MDMTSSISIVNMHVYHVIVVTYSDTGSPLVAAAAGRLDGVVAGAGAGVVPVDDADNGASVDLPD